MSNTNVPPRIKEACEEMIFNHLSPHRTHITQNIEQSSAFKHFRQDVELGFYKCHEFLNKNITLEVNGPANIIVHIDALIMEKPELKADLEPIREQARLTMEYMRALVMSMSLGTKNPYWHEIREAFGAKNKD